MGHEGIKCILHFFRVKFCCGAESVVLLVGMRLDIKGRMKLGGLDEN